MFRLGRSIGFRYQQVADRLREAILRGDLQPGNALPAERELAETFGVSRTSVREAIRALEVQGLVASMGNTTMRSVTVPAADGPLRTAIGHLLTMKKISLRDLVEVRCALEAEALSLAAQRRPEAAMSDALGALRDMRSRPEIAGFDAADVRFHLALVQAAENRAMYVMMLAIRDEMGRHLRKTLESKRNTKESIARLVAEHESIYRAVQSGDSQAAGELVRKHITSFYHGSVGDTAMEWGPRP